MHHTDPISKMIVPDNQRMEIADQFFGLGYVLQFEPRVFQLAEALAADYDGSYWAFYTLSNGGFYMAPTAQPQYNVRSENGYAGSVNADTLGIIVCLYAYSDLSFGTGKLAQTCATHYHLLREFALGCPDADTILAAID